MQFVWPLLIALILGVLALAFVLYPFYRRPSAPATSGEHKAAALFQTTDERETEMANGHAKASGLQSFVTSSGKQEEQSEQGARTALHEIELDYQLGNISENDYRVLRERYLRRALVALKSRYDREQELDDVIEVQLQKMKEHDSSE